MITKIIIGVLFCAAFIGWVAWRVGKHAERTERDPKYRRRWMYLFGVLFLLPAILEVVDVAKGVDPKSRLLGVPISLLIAWFYLRAGYRVKISPEISSLSATSYRIPPN